MVTNNFSLPILALLLGAIWGAADANIMKTLDDQEATLESPENAGLEVEPHQVDRRHVSSRNLLACGNQLRFLKNALEAHAEAKTNVHLFGPDIKENGLVAKMQLAGTSGITLKFSPSDIAYFSCLSNVARLRALATKAKVDVKFDDEVEALAQTDALPVVVLHLLTAYASQTEKRMLMANNVEHFNSGIVTLRFGLGLDSVLENVVAAGLLGEVAASLAVSDLLVVL